MSNNTSDVMLAKPLLDRMHRPLRLLCAALEVPEKKHLQGIPQIQNLQDVCELFRAVVEDAAFLNNFDMSINAGLRVVEGTPVAEYIVIILGDGDDLKLKIQQDLETLVFVGHTWGLSSTDARATSLNGDTPDELDTYSHMWKRIAHNALEAFPLPDVGDASMVRSSLISLVDYKPIGQFHIERHVAANILKVLTLLDAIRGVEPENENSLSLMWAVSRSAAGGHPLARVLSETLRMVDDNLEVELVGDLTQPIVVEAIFSYPMADGRILEISVDTSDAVVDMGFALFVLDGYAEFFPDAAGVFFRDTTTELKQVCMTLLDKLAPFASEVGETQRRRAMRVVSASLPSADAA